MTEEQKQFIDGASYEELLRIWRFGKSGSPWFEDDCGKYFAEQMAAKRDAAGHDAAVRASKNVGWEK